MTCAHAHAIGGYGLRIESCLFEDSGQFPVFCKQMLVCQFFWMDDIDAGHESLRSVWIGTFCI